MVLIGTKTMQGAKYCILKSPCSLSTFILYPYLNDELLPKPYLLFAKCKIKLYNPRPNKFS
jgi:hypothetical protein